MWSFASTVLIEQRFATWEALVGMADDGVPSTHRLAFAAQPSAAQVAAAGSLLAARLNSSYGDGELQGFIDGLTFQALKYQTAAQLADRFRIAFRAASNLVAARMAYWLVERVTAGDFTQAQVKNAFGFDQTQYNAFAARMTTLHDAYAAALAAQGE